VSVDSGAGATGVKWHNGGIDTSLLNILLQWLIAEGNYNHYCGASYSALPSSKGKTKDNYCTEISDLLKRAGIKIERQENVVQAKSTKLKAPTAKQMT
jgi:hypothetical protein